MRVYKKQSVNFDKEIEVEISTLEAYKLLKLNSKDQRELINLLKIFLGL